MTGNNNSKVNSNDNGHSNKTMLTSRELAQAINVHINTVRRWSDLGLIHAYRIGSRRDRRFSRDEVIPFLEQGHEFFQKVT